MVAEGVPETQGSWARCTSLATLKESEGLDARQPLLSLPSSHFSCPLPGRARSLPPNVTAATSQPKPSVPSVLTCSPARFHPWSGSPLTLLQASLNNSFLMRSMCTSGQGNKATGSQANSSLQKPHFLLLERVLLCSWPQILILLPQLPECWDYRCILLCLT